MVPEHVRVEWGALSKIVAAELDRQAEKWGVQSHHMDYWFVIVSEELGEVARAVCERNLGQAQREIAQAIACLAQLSWQIETNAEDRHA